MTRRETHRTAGTQGAVRSLASAALAATIACAAHSCAGTGKKQVFREKQTVTVNAKTARQSADLMEGYRAYEVPFVMKGEAKKMRITMSSVSAADPLSGKKKELRVYFVLDKAINVKRFRQRPRDVVYSEVARNYDTSFGARASITVSPAPSDPMRSLEEGSAFRLRFTTFSAEGYEFTLDIESDPGVEFTGAR